MPSTTRFSLLQCPFCGATSMRLVECDDNQFAVCCDACLAIGPSAETDARAGDRWNQAARSPRPRQHEERKPK
jgi:Lar family restriction alleviation protein